MPHPDEVRVGKQEPTPPHVILSEVEGPARAALVRIGLAKAKPTAVALLFRRRFLRLKAIKVTAVLRRSGIRISE